MKLNHRLFLAGVLLGNLAIAKTGTAVSKTDAKASSSTQSMDGLKAPAKPTSQLEEVRRRQDEALLKGQKEKEIREEMQALEMILNNKKRKDGANELLLRRAFLYYKLGRARLLTSPNPTANKPQYFADAQRTVADLIELHKKKEITLSRTQQALLLFIRGSISQELNNEKAYIDDFSLSIKLDSKLPQSPSMALILGETYFDKEKYKEAIAWYQKLKDQYDPHQRSIADFKTGWSWLLLKELNNAQFYFLRVANQIQSQSFRDESVRALAYIVSQGRSEKWIVEFARKSLRDESLRLVFLTSIIQNIHNQDKTKVPYLVFSEVYRNTKEPSAKIKVLGLLIGYEKREVPTLGQKKAFEYLEGLIRKNPKLAWRSWMTEVLDLEPDIRAYIQILSDFYVGKIPTKLDLDKSKIVDLLNREIVFYIEFLMTPQTKKPMLNLWIDLIHREQNIQMAQSAINVIGALNPGAPDEFRRARLEYIAILDSKASETPEVRKTLIADIEDFTAKYPQDEEKSRLLSRLAELYMLDNQYEKALPKLKELYAIQPTETNGYNYLLSLFKSDKLQDVVNSDVAKNLKKSAKIQDILRDSHLKLAQDAQKNNDQKSYEENLRAYLETNPKADQAALIKSGLLLSFIQNKKIEQYCAERTGMKDKEKADKNVLGTEEKALDAMFLDGPILSCHWSSVKGPESRDFKMALYDQSMKKALPNDFGKSLSKWTEEQRQVILGLLAVTKPKAVLKIEPQPKMTEITKSLYWIALQLSQGKTDPTIPANLKKYFSNVKFAPKPSRTKSSIPKIVEEANFPQSTLSVEKYSKFLEDLIYRSKLIKTKFQKEAPDATDELRKEMIEKSSAFERKVAETIRSSPVPKGLSEEETKNYVAELNNAAVDFDKQAEEYDKALGELNAKMFVAQQEAESKRVADITADKWFWANDDEYEKVKKTFEKDGAFYTLLKLETNRAAKTLSDVDYIRMRAGTLLMIRHDEVMRKMIREELMALNAQNILEKWKEIK
jgi:hypothetical protein